MPVITSQAPLPAPTAAQVATEIRQTATNVEPEVATEVTATKEETLSPKFAALARREKTLLARDKQLKAREDALKAKEVEYQTSYVPKSKIAERFKSDPLGVLNEYEVTPDQFTQALLNQNPQDPIIHKLLAKVEALENNQSQTLTKLEEKQKQDYEQAVNQIRTDAKLLVDSDESYSTIKETNASEAVVELIKQTFDSEGTIMSVEDAAKAVEEYLIEEGLKMASLPKVKLKMSPQVATEKSQIVEKPQQIKTLTNAHNVSSSKPRSSEKDRIERAKLAFMGQLK